MMVSGVFVASAKHAIAMLRNKTLFVIDTKTKKTVHLELLATDNSAENGPQRITCVEFFASEDTFSLLLLVDERKLMHYAIDIDTNSLALRASREVPRNATCMTIGHVQIQNESKTVVIVGEKTGEAVAFPFPALAQDAKTLLGHTTSMITHMALNKESNLLLTADRDEKIRVSRFPQTHVIASYCLGHTASVLKIACCQELIVSVSIDNTIKLWNMTNGSLLDSTSLIEKEETLAHASLAVCPATNTIAVVTNHNQLKLWKISANNTLEMLRLPIEYAQNAPCDAVFVPEDGTLVVAYKQSPFLQHLQITGDVVTTISTDDALYTMLREAAASIALPVDTEDAQDELEDGLKKKKVKTAIDWKAKLPSL